MTEDDTKLNLLRAATADLSFDQSREFDDYFIGALATVVPLEEWKECLASAQRCYDGNATRRDAERARKQ